MKRTRQQGHQQSATWFKSSYSTGSANCVEAAVRVSGASIRDSKNHRLGTLSFDHGEWQALLGTARHDVD